MRRSWRVALLDGQRRRPAMVSGRMVSFARAQRREELGVLTNEIVPQDT
jgi:hypothetical protein